MKKIFSKKEKVDKKTETSVSGGAVRTESRIDGARQYIVRKPLLTEKASRLEGDENSYVFLVHPRANKAEVKKEVQRLFNVGVVSVNMVNEPRKRKMFRGHVGFKSGEKKAIVKIEQGKKIEILPT